MRFQIEFFKEPETHIGYIFGYFTMGQLLSVMTIIIGVIILFGKPKKIFSKY